MLFEFGGDATFSVFGTIEVPDGTDAEEFAMDPANRKLIWAAMQEYWDNTGIKFRDARVTVSDGGPAGDDVREDFTAAYDVDF